ncbi:MAG: HAD-IC family P-type ATPase [Candidatus Staskawiczbacteria bacterium]|nr:HAD-IC family P-type ATPase [Candidatus Staskawiczbacteria bacterium]
MENNWHIKSISEIFLQLSTSENGLDEKDVMERIERFGKNKLPEAKTDSIFAIFFRQFASPLIYILLISCVIVFLMGEFVDALVIVGVLLLNAFIGSIQEGRAQKTISALKKFVETNATVVRGGKEIILKDSEIVPGDIIILQEGEKVPADLRIISSHNLKVDESALTGESGPVHKSEKMNGNPNMPFIEQKNMLFKGTYAVSGNAMAVVVSIGLETFIGKISKEISVIDTEIPLKKNISQLSRFIVVMAVLIGVALFMAGIFLGKPPREMFATVVSLLVSIIPEGLPVVMTLVLASGVWRMTKQNALVKRLQAVEALGQASIIAVDKTGTITKNELMVKKVYAGGSFFDVEGVGYSPSGAILSQGGRLDPMLHPELLLLGKISIFCANAKVVFSSESQIWQVAGDPTEAAMLVFAKKLGFSKEKIENEFPRVSEIPFDFKTKYHASLNSNGSSGIIAVAGAPETILSICSKVMINGKNEILEKEERKKLEDVFISISKEGMRLVALATGSEASNILSEKNMGNLSFVGFIGMRDGLRPEINQSIREANSAGIKVVMITGDHKVTAEAIAREAGIYKSGDDIMLGQEIDSTSDADLLKKIANTSVFARVTPQHKLRIIQLYKKAGEIIAMTGDGVNDAPSLVAADLGVAMGKIGTEVTKEASDIVLLDDNFKSIIYAIEEGRNIYKTIKKVILYLFSTSMGEVLVISIALLIGLSLPLLPVQIIWLNLVTDGFLTVSLAMEKKEKGLLKGKFKKPGKYLIDKLMAFRIITMALPMAIGTIYLFGMYAGEDMIKALTVSLTALSVFQWFNAYNCRSEEKSIFSQNPFSNIFLVIAMIIVISLQILAVYSPFLNKFLHTSPLDVKDWVLIIIVSSSILITEEIRKLLFRFFNKK